jgi:hypothetical protein
MVAHRLAQRANALVLLDNGRGCGTVANVPLVDKALHALNSCFSAFF